MDDLEENRLYTMLDNVSKYSVEQPKVVQKYCEDLFISPAYAPAIDLLVEAFLSVHSFCLLMFEGLVSNASAILRILIEQVSAISVIAKNERAMSEFLKFNTWKKQYYALDGEDKEKLVSFLVSNCGIKKPSKNAIKDYLDYGWIRVINNDKSERSERLILKEAHLEEMIIDVNEQLNAFSHGQRSIFQFIQNKNLADRYISRIIMCAGKLFLFLCHSKTELLSNKEITQDKFFENYLNAKVLFLILNSKATNKRICELVKESQNLDEQAKYTMSTIDHMRGLLYSSELDFLQTNTIGQAYVYGLKNLFFMLCFKIFETKFKQLTIKDISVYDLGKIIGFKNLYPYFQMSHTFPLEKILEFADKVDDNWGIADKNLKFNEFDEAFVTDFTSFIQSMFNSTYSDEDVSSIQKRFVTIV